MSKDIDVHINEFLDLHRSQVVSHQTDNKKLLSSKDEFNKHQADFFDEQSEWYISESAAPQTIKEKLTSILEIVKGCSIQDNKITVLDVGSGAGVLIPFINNVFKNVNIHAIDISQKQLNNLHSRFPEVVLHQGDISAFTSKEKYNLILCNACFGNFYSQTDALYAMSKLLSEDGIIVISHPLGATFVAQLHELDPNTVPHLLPTTETQIKNLCKGTLLEVEKLINEEDFYLLILKCH